jgi:uncharacterized protein (DUF488 family)
MQREPLSRPPIYTIGHSGHEQAAFFSLLTCHGIDMLIDVRTHPYSRCMPQFSKNALEASLRPWGVDYLFLGRELGGRAPGTVAAGIEHVVSFARGLDRIMELWREASRLALLCAEEDPRRCHRAGRIAPALLARGARVVHIRGDGRLEPHTPAWTDLPMNCQSFEDPK